MSFPQTASLTKFWRLPAGERRFLVQTVAVLIAARLGLWLLPFKPARRLAFRVGKLFGRSATVPPARVPWAIARASRVVPRASCLPQAIAAESLLRLMGCSVTLQIGVAKPDNRILKAHAWIESRGRVVVGGDGVERYWPLSPGTATESPGRWP
jgi:hypothetical protein